MVVKLKECDKRFNVDEVEKIFVEEKLVFTMHMFILDCCNRSSPGLWVTLVRDNDYQHYASILNEL